MVHNMTWVQSRRVSRTALASNMEVFMAIVNGLDDRGILELCLYMVTVWCLQILWISFQNNHASYEALVSATNGMVSLPKYSVGG